MTLNKSHPLYDVLAPCEPYLLYTEAHALAQGRYAELAERLQSKVQRERYLFGFLHGTLLMALLYTMAAAVSAGGPDNIVWAAMVAVWLPLSVLGYRKRHRAIATAVARLRQAADMQAGGRAQ